MAELTKPILPRLKTHGKYTYEDLVRELDEMKRILEDSFQKLDDLYSNVNHNHDARYFTKEEIEASFLALANVYAPKIHDHDARYYTETEINALQLTLANSIADRLLKSGGDMTGEIRGPRGPANMLLKLGSSDSNDYNLLFAVETDTPGDKLIAFVNGSTRAGDGGPNTATIRNDRGPLRLGSTGHPLRLEGSEATVNGNNVRHAGNWANESRIRMVRASSDHGWQTLNAGHHMGMGRVIYANLNDCAYRGLIYGWEVLHIKYAGWYRLTLRLYKAAGTQGRVHLCRNNGISGVWKQCSTTPSDVLEEVSGIRWLAANDWLGIQAQDAGMNFYFMGEHTEVVAEFLQP